MIFLKFLQKNKDKYKGFILPLTLIIVTITLAITMGITTLLSREIYFSKISRESSIAYYAADSGLSCAIFTDDSYTDTSTGIGIFAYDDTHSPDSTLVSVNAKRTARGLPNIVLSNIKCGTAAIFSTSTSAYSISPYTRIRSNGTQDIGKTTTFTMNMDLGDGTFRCVSVIVNKTPTYRQVISRGYNTCNITSSRFIERAVINTTESD